MTSAKAIPASLPRPSRGSESKRPMTPEERKRDKDARSANYFKLMEKYGPKQRFLIEKENNISPGDGPIETVGFVVKFSLSHAYKSLERQELEASIPDIKPVKKRKHTKFRLPSNDVSTDDVNVAAPKPADIESNNSMGQSTRRLQIRAKLQARTGTGSVWKRLTRQKASDSVQSKERERRRQAGTPRGQRSSENESRDAASQKTLGANRSHLKTDTMPRPGSRIPTSGPHHPRSSKAEGSRGESDWQGSDSDSVFRLFSDSLLTASVTLEAVTASGSRSRPSSSRPSSAHRKRSVSKTPQTSTPAHSTAAGGATSRSRVKQTQRASSATRPSTRNSGGKGNTAPPTRGRTQVAPTEGDDKESDPKILAPRKVCKYLYHMCNCQHVASKNTLSKLFKKNKVAGVIELYGCPRDTDPRRNLVCPFCSVLPRQRIHAWLDEVEY